jgi:hypothetical protein
VGSTLYETATLNGTGYYFQTIDMPTSLGSIVHAEVVKNGVTYVIGGGLQIGANGKPTNAYYASPLVLDLNGDGVQTTDAAHGVQFDVSNSGTPQQTSWVDKHDGLLAIDLNGDGQINSGAELFGNSTKLANGITASNGWAALGALDSNHDGKVDAQDAGFDKLRVWVDADSDGVTDAGELHTLAEVKVESIDLNADSTIAYQNGNVLQGLSSYQSTDGTTHEVVDVWFQVTSTGVKTLNNGESLDLSNVSNLSLVKGVTEAGQTTADGSSMLVADALFAFNALDYNVDGQTVNLLGSNMTLDLSSIVAVHSHVTEVDLTGTGANTLKLNLTDVLSLPTTNGMHQLTLTGDADDFAQRNGAGWFDTGATVTQAGHAYEVYHSTQDSSVQVLIDQAILNAGHGM